MAKENLTVKKSVLTDYITKRKLEVMDRKPPVTTKALTPTEIVEGVIPFDNSDAVIRQMEINIEVMKEMTAFRNFILEQ